jgi:patatin-like phospholipase/ASCH domain-containing protein
MKSLSIRQPWASLIISGVKDVENRTWPTRYRGPVLIHASLRVDDTSSEDIERRFGVRLPAELPLGGIVGISESERNSEAVRELASCGCPTRMHVVRLLAPQLECETHTKDIDFSPSGIMQRWDAGYAHTQLVLERKPWVGEFDPLSGVILHEQAELIQIAAE